MNSLNYIKAVFFDFDGVIVDSENIYCQLMLDYNQYQKINISQEYYISELIGKSRMEISRILKEKYQDEFDESCYWDGLLEYRKEYLANHNIPIKQGYEFLIKYLKENNFFTGIVSSSSLNLVQTIILENNVNINDFDLIVTRENVQKLKPYPDLYEYALAQSGFAKDEIVAIEDSKVGIQSALDSHIQVIHVQDLSIVPDSLLSKCMTSVLSLDEVALVLKKGGKNGNIKI